MDASPCLICQNIQNNELIGVKELQLGFLEKFTYQLCGNCGSLQLMNPPADFTKYYPNENYYSFSQSTRSPKKAGYFRLIKTKYLLYNEHKLLGPVITLGYKVPEYYPWMKYTNARLNDSILDVGCGTGDLLKKLYKMGFRNLSGIDPFINDDIDYGDIKIQKKDIFQLSDNYDVIMMHHSLEHMSDPLDALKKAWSLLDVGHYLLVRLPVMGNYGWKKYGEFWSGIDAPRHFFIPTENGMRMLAKKAGFEIERIEYDSTDYMIWSSEQYKKGISLYDPKSYMVNRRNGYFTKEQVRQFRKEIEEENKKGNSDTAAFYMVKCGRKT